jgi:hypothetical protein
VQHHVQAGPFLVQPPGKSTPPGTILSANVQLHERACIRLLFPRRGTLARAQPHHDITDADRLSGLQRHFARQAVALVEQTQNRNTARHRRRAERGVDTAGKIDVGDARLRQFLVERRLHVGLRTICHYGLAVLPAIVSEPPSRAQAGDERRPAEPVAACHASGVQAS